MTENRITKARTNRAVAGMFTVQALAACLILSACGGGSSSSDDSSDGGLRKVTVGLIPIVDVAPVYLGIQQGFFKKHDIDVKVEFGDGGAAPIPST